MYQNLHDNFVQIPNGGQAIYTRHHFWPIILLDRISIKTLFFGLHYNSGGFYDYETTAFFGIYSITGSTLTQLASASFSNASTTSTARDFVYLTVTNWNSTIDLSPGNYWLGGKISVKNIAGGGLDFASVIGPYIAFGGSSGLGAPQGFVGGYFSNTNSTFTSLLQSANTSQIRQGNFAATKVWRTMPHIILSA